MGWLRERLGIYGPDLVLGGLVVIVAVVLASAADVASQWAVGGGILGWLAVRVLAEGRAAARGIARGLLKRAKSWVAEPTRKRVLGPVARSPITKVVVAIVVVGALGWLVWRATDDYGWVGAGLAVMAAGLAGQFWWFRRAVAEWRAANAGASGA